MSALNPLQRIGTQIAEVIHLHRDISNDTAMEMVDAALARVDIADMAMRYPHELSGGQRQRVLIAMATILKPQLLLADEPTTALDSVTQRQMLALLKALAQENAMAVLLVTHDLALVADIAQQVHIMQAGRIVESGAPATVLRTPKHDHTKALVAAAKFRLPGAMTSAEPPLLQLQGICSAYDTYGLFGSARREMLILIWRSDRVKRWGWLAHLAAANQHWQKSFSGWLRQRLDISALPARLAKTFRLCFKIPIAVLIRTRVSRRLLQNPYGARPIAAAKRSAALKRPCTPSASILITHSAIRTSFQGASASVFPLPAR
jgi:hypothetical protein